MKNRKNIELDVDFIGGDEPLTTEEKELISGYLRKQKEIKKINNNTKPVRSFRTGIRKSAIGGQVGVQAANLS